VGSVFFLSAVGWVTAGAWTFVIGSLLFVLGACVNVRQIVRADSKLTLQLMNLTALTFVVGSVLFAVASISYLWPAAPEPFVRNPLCLSGLAISGRQPAVLPRRPVQLLGRLCCRAKRDRGAPTGGLSGCLPEARIG
jgi:hypothetical protein